MKKHGFTLAETIITLGIIGIIAALILPFVNRSKPSETKVMYLKAYHTLEKTVRNISHKSSLYPAAYTFNDEDGNLRILDTRKIPLFNDSQPLAQGYETFTGATKLCNLVADAMNGENINCSVGTAITEPDWANTSFTTPNGMSWIIAPAVDKVGPRREEERWQATFLDVAYLKLKPTDDNFYTFYITADGGVHIGDGQGSAYAKTKLNWRKNDQADADPQRPEASFVISDRNISQTEEELCRLKGNSWYWDASTQECKQCSGGQIYNGSTCACPADKHWNGSSCITCPDGKYWDEATQSCKDNTGCTKTQADCANDETFDPEQCKCVANTHSCPSGQHWDATQNKCVDDDKNKIPVNVRIRGIITNDQYLDPLYYILEASVPYGQKVDNPFSIIYEDTSTGGYLSCVISSNPRYRSCVSGAKQLNIDNPYRIFASTASTTIAGGRLTNAVLDGYDIKFNGFEKASIEVLYIIHNGTYEGSPRCSGFAADMVLGNYSNIKTPEKMPPIYLNFEGRPAYYGSSCATTFGESYELNARNNFKIEVNDRYINSAGCDIDLKLSNSTVGYSPNIEIIMNRRY